MGEGRFARLAMDLVACDPSRQGVCCAAKSFCHFNAICSSDLSATNLVEMVRAVPKCTCSAGFYGDGRSKGSGCTNIDECRTGEAGCEHLCKDKTPGFECSCRPGYVLMPDGRSCGDVDECSTGLSGCSHGCVNLQGSYECRCPQGYEMGEDKRTCIDIDECKGGGPCDGRCYNTRGGFLCSCPPGYRLDPVKGVRCIDRNECLEGLVPNGRAACGADSQLCTNVPGSFQCNCKTGYQQTTQPPLTTNTLPRALQQQRRNSFWTGGLFGPVVPPAPPPRPASPPSTIASLQLAGTANDRGELLIGFGASEPAGMAEVAAEADFSWLVCSDINECEVHPRLYGQPACSPPRTRCNNTSGSFTCECSIGQVYSALINDCTDVMEQVAAPALSPAVGIQGEWRREEKAAGCGNCPAANSHECVLVGESYKCVCRRGYRDVGRGACEDINECEENPCRNSSRPCCLNRPGGFHCVAKQKRPLGGPLSLGWKVCAA
eukprot:GHVS01004330.1.p1 GENE.GHVS01004330.1~~GHVS01004330.1.p1  ORF type:complete len:491 (-),score=57.57 GHVS01004330.1:349-1821(-)